ncbi:MAG: ABC transporter substrate-binding protein [Methanospirillum sp.]|uniref:ABC transporter substrate-binding protein n=1 Tax=Methanospirillum sp. TaxID=45200 RepID=UPI002369297B|nr:ABC transporter substrate-binding protein [Methanospirillum sp.]MDD1728042.1 ABC transporter substrate-binding protein [Methanospirillum sp.]
MKVSKKWRQYVLLTGVVVSLIIFSGCIKNSDIQESNNSISITDVNGEIFLIHTPVTRIVTQNSDLAEMLIVLGAEGTIVGASDSVLDIPDIAKKIPHAESIGNWQTPNIEKILSMNPDLIITYGGRTKNIDQILAANISVVALDLYHVPTLPRESRILGKITGREARSEEYAAFVEKYITLIENRLNSQNNTTTPRIYMEHYGEYASEGKDGAGTELMTLLHASHIGEDLPELTQKVSPEWIIKQKPEVIIKIVSNKSLTQNDLEQTRENIMNRTGFDTIPAVESGRVYVINADLLNSPRGIVGTFYAAQAVYPELFTDINPDEILSEYAAQFYSDADQISAKCAPAS